MTIHHVVDQLSRVSPHSSWDICCSDPRGSHHVAMSKINPPLPPTRETSLTTFSPLHSSCKGTVNTGFTVDCTAPEVVSGPAAAATPGPGSRPVTEPGLKPVPGSSCRPVTVAGLRPGHMPGSPPVPGERVDTGCQTLGVFTLRCPRPVTAPLIPQAR